MEEKTNCVPVAPQPDAQKEKRRRKIRRIAGKIALYVIMCAIAVVMVIPFYWSIITSIRPKEEILRLPVTWFPGSFTAEHYKYVFDTIPFWEMLFNSILVTCIGLFTNLFFGSLAAYAFSKIRFSGHKVIFNILLTSMMIPGVITLIPTFFVLLRFPLAGGNNLFGQGGIFFDDNIWVAKEFYYAYVNLGDVKYLNEAINIVNWIIGEGYESAEGLNGIYWKWGAKFLFENKAGGGLDDNNHASLNACSSAPTSMMLVKLYNAMGDESLNGKFDSMRADYLLKAQNIYEFCYSVLRNPSSGCIRDKIFLAEGFEDMGNSDGRIQLMDAQELPYNTGTFMTAGAELYNCAKASGSELLASVYLDRNKDVAESADRQFANRMVVEGQYSYNSNSWFTSFLLEGFIDLSEAIPECAEYIEHMRSALDYGWNNNRADDGLVCPAWIEGWSAFNDSNPNSEGNPRQILLQSANAHCYAMLARYYAHS